eukprot:SAG31_NODE_1821_length_7194_cov_11.104863_11_plen_84_part_00
MLEHDLTSRDGVPMHVIYMRTALVSSALLCTCLCCCLCALSAASSNTLNSHYWLGTDVASWRGKGAEGVAHMLRSARVSCQFL